MQGTTSFKCRSIILESSSNFAIDEINCRYHLLPPTPPILCHASPPRAHAVQTQALLHPLQLDSASALGIFSECHGSERTTTSYPVNGVVVGIHGNSSKKFGCLNYNDQKSIMPAIMTIYMDDKSTDRPTSLCDYTTTIASLCFWKSVSGTHSKSCECDFYVVSRS